MCDLPGKLSMAAIVLLSGGLDSAVNLKQAADDRGVVLALTFLYGQRAAPREQAAAAAMCQVLGLPHRLVELPWLAELGASGLTSRAVEVPTVTPDDLSADAVAGGAAAEAVWVPNRNGLFVNIAASFAESVDADTIVAGFNAEEAATFPDNSADFVCAATRALEFSTRGRVHLTSHTQHLDKTEIVRLGRRIEAPLCHVWSCYRGGEEHCWRCESCARLRRALTAAGEWEWFLRAHR